jgi:hypothetical protein
MKNKGNKDLLKEAIADAKAVKETALANAKIALEEAFTPRLQSMLSHKIAEELEDEEVPMGEEEEFATTDEYMGEEDEMGGEFQTDEPVEEEDEMGGEFQTDEPVEEEDEMGGEFETKEPAEEDDDDEMGDLDLESIIRELEGEMGGEPAEEENPEITELKKIRERVSKRLQELESSEIGAGDNKVANYDSETDDEQGTGEFFEEEGGDEEVDLNEVIRALREMNGEEPADEEEGGMTEEEAEEMKSDLEEAYKVIKSLKNTINEVNLLNAKLLYTNKLFRNFDLNEKQKVKVVENFDRASSLREVKLVFATLGENLNVAKKSQKNFVRESFASKPTKGTKPAGIITEGSSLATRFQKLANIKK